MNAQLDLGSSSVLDRRIPAGQARRVGHGIGELTVLAGRVWITGHGDGEDRVLEAGERLQLARADAAVVESFDAGRPAEVAWRPQHAIAQRGGLRELFFAGLAVFAAFARRAASNANLAQGRIACGDSIASSGALK